MRQVSSALLVAAVLAAATGCGQKKTFDGPTVEAFNGRVTANGKAVTLPPGEKTALRLLHQGSGKSWGIPLQPDGTFNIGWMPIGKYTVMVTRPPVGGRGGQRVHVVPIEFEIVDGQTEYTIELGKGFKL
jgi:hypothetical protein